MSPRCCGHTISGVRCKRVPKYALDSPAYYCYQHLWQTYMVKAGEPVDRAPSPERRRGYRLLANAVVKHAQ